MLREEEVKHIAKLARISLKEKEILKYKKQLTSILDYFEKIKKAETEEILPTVNISGLKNVFRSDESKPESGERRKKLIEAAPEKENGLIKVKSVFER